MIPSVYEPKPVESEWARLWQENGLFLAKVPEDKNKKSFVIVIPPPNITGALHMGHALNNTLQDVLIRWKKMSGYEAYWAPGTDHGGIATQNVMEKILKSEKKRKEDLGREKFLERMLLWRKECGGTILEQLKRLGCALDFSAENVRFTMDETRAKAVFEEFKRLQEKGLIYRGERMINWCVRCGTALSDIEVEHEESHSKLWHIHYPLEDGGRGIVVATTRPETMLGDTAVAVNPSDSRYKGIVGRKVRLPLADRLIPVVADDAIDASFGTGGLKVTPGHDPVDFEIGRRHNLPSMQVISFEGRMINSPAKYEGKDRALCRHEIIEDLKAGGYLEKEEPYKHAVGICYRCSQHIEPLVSEQWFVKMDSLAKKALQSSLDGKIKFHPESWEKPYLDWLKNIQDWCISRQIWWGHRVPVWYCPKCSGSGLIFAGTGTGKELKRVSFKQGAKPAVFGSKPGKCSECGCEDLVQDPDVLDTWFSSALWPFSVFGWPEKTKELAYYYPTSVLVTGYEILYLWVARMVMMGIEFLGQEPFRDVYLHGIVRDRQGKKMSKSLGNVVDPLKLMDKYGTDAVRFALVYQAVPGRDIQFGEESITGARNFCNKIYNAARFMLMNLPEKGGAPEIPQKLPELCDRWILHRYSRAVKEALDAFEEFDAARALSSLYKFLWDDYCDWYVELSKPRLQSQDKETVLAVLSHVLSGTLKALHPFMPYITEELSRQIKKSAGSKEEFLMREKFPSPEGKYQDSAAEAEMEAVMGIVSAVRAVRSQFAVPPAQPVTAVISSSSAETVSMIRKNAGYISQLSRAVKLDIGAEIVKPPHCATAVFKDAVIYVPLEGLIDIAKERSRLERESEKISAGLRQWEEKLSDSEFLRYAPETEVSKIRKRRDEFALGLKQLQTALRDL